MALGCRASEPGTNSTGSTDSRVVTSNVPPFSTREPERYQAVRIVTFNESSSSGTTMDRTSRVSIARDGEKRREEYFIGAGETVVYLEVPVGRFVLLPASGIYADLNEAATQTQRELLGETDTLSTDLLLSEGYSTSTYEKLGTELLDGRMTTKYRVTSGNTGEATGGVETFIWIDESIGMPVRSQSISGVAGQASKSTMELKGIKLEVDNDLFKLPASYRKVERRLVFERIQASRKRAMPG